MNVSSKGYSLLKECAEKTGCQYHIVRRCGLPALIRKYKNNKNLILYLAKNDFKNKFIQLKYSKQDTPDNMKVKYIINKMYCYFTNGKEEIFPDNGSIEHILPESSGERALNIGNLILLEIKLNNNAGQATYADKRQKYYLESNYDWVKIFIDEHTSWTEEDVLVRAENMADIYYHKILERN